MEREELNVSEIIKNVDINNPVQRRIFLRSFLEPIIGSHKEDLMGFFNDSSNKEECKYFVNSGQRALEAFGGKKNEGGEWIFPPLNKDDVLFVKMVILLIDFLENGIWRCEWADNLYEIVAKDDLCAEIAAAIGALDTQKKEIDMRIAGLKKRLRQMGEDFFTVVSK